MSELKTKVAVAALDYIGNTTVLGIGTGSTVNCFIDELAKIRHKIEACVSSSIETETRLRAAGIPVIELTAADELELYIDGADEVNTRCELIKGGGGALTREKIIATAAKTFICMIDESKFVPHLGACPIAVEVIPMARSFVARQLVKLGGDPEYRHGFVTNNGNIILDVYNMSIGCMPTTLEDLINGIPGVVENGIFGHRLPDHVLVAGTNSLSHHQPRP
jgi:ribose 5-phosphate isomerase A